MTGLLIATDAWRPQINGVVRTLEATTSRLVDLGLRVDVLTPALFRSFQLPTYPEIRIACPDRRSVEATLEKGHYDAVHIATEGPVGMAMRAACLRRGLAFTTSYHTRFPEYLSARAPIPERWTYAWLRRFHAAASATMVATDVLERELAGRGFRRLAVWSRGVDTDLFRPDHPSTLDLPRPIFLSVGRLAVEKNLPAFLDLPLPGTRLVVGDGPERAALQTRYPDAVFLGSLKGEELASVYAAADVFVFPSRTDTYGIVLLEALASGLPLAAYPDAGPGREFERAGVAMISDDLRAAALAALRLPRERCRAFALSRSWERSTREFRDNLVLVSGHRLAA